MKKTGFIFFSLFLLFIPFFVHQCAWEGASVGVDDNIIVFADSLDWLTYQPAMNSVFGKQTKMPVLEREFLLRWVPFRNFERYRNQKNIFILGRLDSQLPVSKSVKQLLNQDVIDGVKSGKYFYIPKKEAWAVDQYLMFLVAESRDDMVQKIYDLGDLIYKDFRKFYFTRLKKQMFAHQEQKKLEQYIAENFPFKMRIQHDYFIADENIAERYVWIRRLQPDRSILISWQEPAQDFKLTPRWVIDERNRLAKMVYKGDVVVEEETRAYNVQFKGRNALRLEGTWKNEELMVGGPFRNISFLDKDANKIYSLDFYVQAIGKRKKPFLDQLDVIIHTFEPKPANETHLSNVY